MRTTILLVACLAAVVLCDEMLVTQEYTDYLKKHSSWEVADYEDNIFRGWTLSEAAALFAQEVPSDDMPSRVEHVTPGENFPAEMNWNELRADCVHAVGNQGTCGSSWAFSAVGTISDRCCLRLKDHGWLSVQELISCDKNDEGCNGGMPTDVYAWAIAYGIVPDSCYPYKAREEACPTKCVDGSDWNKAHVCKCKAKVICKGIDSMKKCLQTGPISVIFTVYADIMFYRSGIYHANQKTQKLGLHTVRCYGYSDKPEAHWLCMNSWGATWGEKGGIRIAVNGGTDMESYETSYCDPYQQAA